MDGGKILILFKNAPGMKQPSFFRIKSGIEPLALNSPAGKAKITGGNDPGDKNKKPGAEQSTASMKYPVPEPPHGRSPRMIRRKINREKVAELRMKSRQGRKWLIRSPFS